MFIVVYLKYWGRLFKHSNREESIFFIYYVYYWIIIIDNNNNLFKVQYPMYRDTSSVDCAPSYLRQLSCVAWGFLTSRYFSLSNGVKQGRVLSSIFFNHYVNEGSNVYCCLLDASKAFDRVHWGRLFKILIEWKVSFLFIRLLLDSYLRQLACVALGFLTSRYFSLSNGVKQGGVLSPILFIFLHSL